MRRFLALLVPAVLVAQAAVAQAAPAFPIPEVRPYVHSGKIEKSFADEEQSTTIFLAMTMDESQIEAFTGRSSKIRNAHLDAGFVHAGGVMTGYPDVVTLVLKIVHPAPSKQLAAPPLTNIAFTVDGRQALTTSAPLVSRSKADGGGRNRHIEDTFVVVLSLNQFLELVNGSAVTATLDQHQLTFTGAPLEGLRDLASRMAIVR